MDIISELGKLKEMKDKISKIENQIEYCKEQAIKISGPVFGEEKVHTQPTCKAPFEKWIWRQLDLEKELDNIKNDFETLSIKITDEITHLIKNEQVLKAFLYREISFMKYMDIAEKLNISKSYVYRLHDLGAKVIKHFNKEK